MIYCDWIVMVNIGDAVGLMLWESISI